MDKQSQEFPVQSCGMSRGEEKREAIIPVRQVVEGCSDSWHLHFCTDAENQKRVPERSVRMSQGPEKMPGYKQLKELNLFMKIRLRLGHFHFKHQP